MHDATAGQPLFRLYLVVDSQFISLSH